MLTQQSLKDVFYCPEESEFYSQCIKELVLKQCNKSEIIVEFGSGDGSPVINSLLETKFLGKIYGFELNDSAYEVAKSNLRKYQLDSKYIVKNQSFFSSLIPNAQYLISNPPYLPAIDNKIYQPLLHGGIDGSEIARQLLSLNYQNVLLMVSSYSNPQRLIEYAISNGYSTGNFMISPLNFGYYSSEPKVKSAIFQMQKKGLAFYSENIYLLAGVLFTRNQMTVDLSSELIQIMTSL
ncbi:MAG: SAM-dependent methyltransferase [Richelia sp. RM2_1_2]|nr:SAM-dependent methyltransferase [Richelia sp. SM1_7_0]NJN06936.1 SAM-dependent methyltransferase [Richelia sp. RM1_1_1]NJO26213.1 SAM-dependent methyltransferase [Richelia sp. SL_2_1]NJO58091.1 SAM-dependent methyltransferase [Richelia sp. RM2_1_2]